MNEKTARFNRCCKGLGEMSPEQRFTVIGTEMLSSPWSRESRGSLQPIDVDIREVLDMAGTPNVHIRFENGEVLSLLSIQVATGNVEGALELLEMGAFVDSAALEHWLAAGEELARAIYDSCSAQTLRQELRQRGFAIEEAETLDRYIEILSTFRMEGDEELLISKLSQGFIGDLVTDYEKVVACAFRKDFRKVAGHLLKLLRENGPR